MTNEKSAGASRRGRRLVLILAAIATVFAAVLSTIRLSSAHGDHDSWEVGDQTYSRPDAEIAAQVLQSVAGVNPLVCATLDRAFDTGSWGSYMLPVMDGSIPPNDAEAARWIGKNHIDRAALEPVKRGLASADACVRRVAARIAGNIDVRRLDEELDAELSSSDANIRTAAVSALGHGEQPASLPRLRKLLSDSDRNVRIATIRALGSIESHDAVNVLLPMLDDRDAGIRSNAVWALGRIEDDAATSAIVRILQQDNDPDVRRIAAWALGKINDH